MESNKTHLAKSQRLTVIAIAALSCVYSAKAAEIETGNTDLSLRWDTTLKYSNAFRLKKQSSALVDDSAPFDRLNLDDGDRNFSRGLVSNRLDVFTELDVSFKRDFGARVSAAGWYDTVYNRDTDNDAPARANQTSVPYNKFPEATRTLHGRKAEFLDAFVYADLGKANVRLGRHSLLYGETLFFGGNGIAVAQSPTDVIKLISVPGSQFKEIILPVNQISGQLQLTEGVALGGYYQFEWRKNRIPASGSYLSSADVLGDGAENFLFAPGLAAPRQPDRTAKDFGQFGLQLKLKPTFIDAEFGLYAVRYHDKNFQAYLRPVGLPPPFGAGSPFPLNYQLVYPEDIKSYGASASTVVGDVNVAAEVSVRRNTPLVSAPEVDPSADGSAGIGASALYAVGNSAHFNLSSIAFLSRNAIWDQASLLAEFAWNRRTAITKNPAALDPNSSKDAWAMRFLLEPQYFQVLPSLDLSVPIGLGYSTRGNSSVVAQFNGGVKKGGDFSLGVKATYQQVWRAGLTYVKFLGAKGPALDAGANFTFLQSLGDRDFVSLSVQRTF